MLVYFYLVILHDTDSNIGYYNIPFMVLHYYTFIFGITTEPGVIPRNNQNMLDESDTVINFDHPNDEKS